MKASDEIENNRMIDVLDFEIAVAVSNKRLICNYFFASASFRVPCYAIRFVIFIVIINLL